MCAYSAKAKEAEMADTCTHPLFFTFKEVVSGNGFLAQVIVKGRAILEQDDDGLFWIYGVQPGGLAAPGKTAQEVLAGFNLTFKEVLYDIASGVSNYDGFRGEVEKFFSEINELNSERWMATRAAFRSEPVKIEDEVLLSLPRDKSEADEGFVEVDRLDGGNSVFTSGDNTLNVYAGAA
jgi:hypothetical protein